MRKPLPLVAVLYAGGLILAQHTPTAGLTWLFLLAMGLGLTALACNSARGILLLLLLPVAGWTNLLARTSVLSPHDLRLLVADRVEFVTLRGTLRATPVLRVSRQRNRQFQRSVVEMDVGALFRAGHWQPAFGRVVASTPGVLDGRYFSGCPVEATGVLQTPRGPVAPGQFDYRGYLRAQGIYYQLRCDNTNDWSIVQTAGRTPGTPPLSDRFCRWAQSCLARGLPEEDESLRLLWAMVLGWKTALTPDVTEPFMQSGTLHIFAISGLHIALIAGILTSLLRALHLSRGAAGLVVIPLIWFYTAATGWQASAIRSTLMMSVVIAGWSLRRPPDLINSLAAAAVIILVWDPGQLFQAGFQLSFLVVLGLALLLPPFEKLRTRLLQPEPLLPPELRPRWKRWLDWPIRALSMSVATSLAAWLGSLPLIAFYFNMVTPGGLLANLVIVPLSSLALMSSLGSLICGAWWPSGSELFNHSAWFWMLSMVRLSRTFAHIPGSSFYVVAPAPWLSGVYYLLLATALYATTSSSRRRLGAWLVLAVLAFVSVGLWCGRRDRIRLSVLPVRAGAVFCDAPGGKEDLLVDCGDETAADTLLKPFLRSQGVNRLRTILLTHGDLAHTGGTELLADLFRARLILTSAAPSRSRPYRALLAALQRAPERWRTVACGDTLGRWEVLHPCEEDRFAQTANGTIVLRGELWGSRVLLLSDLGPLGQRALLQRSPQLHSEILIVGAQNHEADLNPMLVEAVRPRLIIVAGGEFPASGRPGRRLRARLDALGIPVIYTSDSGAALLTFERAGWSVRTMTGHQTRQGR